MSPELRSAARTMLAGLVALLAHVGGNRFSIDDHAT
jgi:hypothetical protein